MTLRKPTYLDPQYGEVEEMSPTQDTIALAGITINGTPSANTDAITVGYLTSKLPGAVKTIEMTLPVTGVFEYTQTFTDSSVTPNSNIVASISGQAATGQDADNAQMDRPWVQVIPGAGQVTAYIQGTEGILGGAYRIGYQISN